MAASVGKNSPGIGDLAGVLQRYWGYDSFLPLQAEAMGHVLAGRDSVVVLPTGGGKSLCFQAPAMCLPGLAIVVSPLISLMKDQVEQLSQLGVPALFLNSSLSFDEYQENMDLVRSAKVRLLYVAPETLLTPRLFNLLSELPFDCLTIDEAHCISEWGHDFRPDYLSLSGIPALFPGVPVAAFTATATERVQKDIIEKIGLREPYVLRASFNRPNLFYQVEQKKDVERQLVDFLKDRDGESGIVYRTTRDSVTKTAT